MKFIKVFALFLCFFFTKGFAAPAPKCTNDGGQHTCIPAVISDWEPNYSISDCWSNTSVYALWCTVRGGKPDSPYYVGGCMGNPTPTTEENYLERANNFIAAFTAGNPNFEPITYEETDWGLSSNACYGSARYKFGGYLFQTEK